MTADVPRPVPPVPRLGEPDIDRLLRLVTGQPPQAETAAALHRQTGGDPRLVLAHILVALSDGRPPLEVLAEELDIEVPPAPARAVLRHEGDYWTIAYGGRTVRLRDARGLHYLAQLLRLPGRSLHVDELARRRAGGLPVSTERARQTVTKGIKSVLDRLRSCHPSLAAHLGASVRRGYECRYEPERDRAVRWKVVVPTPDSEAM